MMNSNAALFSSGLELANLVVASDVLHNSCTAICDLYRDPPFSSTVRYKKVNRNHTTIVAFEASPICSTRQHLQEGDLVSSATLNERYPAFGFLCTKNSPSFSIHNTAITLFSNFHDELSLLKNQLESSGPLIITGHSLGGSIASLFTLWLLENIDPKTTKPPLCITFGSPLIGDNGLQKSISEFSTWNSCFLHVVSESDPIPRLLTPPHNPSPIIDYKPFGTFLLCSESGCACFDDSDIILELLVAMDSNSVGNNYPNEGLQQVIDYASIIERLKKKTLVKGISELGVQITDPLYAGFLTQLETIGISNSQNSNQTFDIYSLVTRMVEREVISVDQKKKVFDPSKKLNDMKIYMAYLEWYKKGSKAQRIGYYDCYKNYYSTSDIDISRYKKKLTNYWKKMVAEVEKRPQKEGAAFRTRWLYSGTNYRRMVEPLDIANYYKEHSNDYKTRGRSEHYILLEKWQKAEENPNNANEREFACSLTEDSCFWAHVEEALISCHMFNNDGSSPEEREISFKKLVEFECYVVELKKKLSPEIFLENSSFMVWWKKYEKIAREETEFVMFMKRHEYRRYV